DGSRRVVNAPPTRIGFVFTASSTSTNVSFNATGAGTGAGTIDNVVLYELTPSPHAGRYTGNATTALIAGVPAVSDKTSHRIAARIDAEGLILVLDGTSELHAGVILNDNTFEVGTLQVSGI